jgi:SAM-dependent methyltransferase
MPAAGGSGWDTVAESLVGNGRHRLWRLYCDGLYGDLLATWLGSQRVARLLKTDLYDEVAGAGLVPVLAGLADEVHGVDLSPRMVAAACARYPSLRGTTADVRRLPFPDGTFDLVVSNSTLDHFEERGDITRSLDELHRVLRPGGRLLISLDNLANPLVALRQALPLDLLRRTRLVPYDVGVTLTPAALRQAVLDAGFHVLDERTLMHAPRVLAVWSCDFSERFGNDRAQSRTLRVLRHFESSTRRRSRPRTGYYAALLAVRPSGP